MTKHNIVHRAYSNHTLAEVFIGSWVDAMERAKQLEITRGDGEYFVRSTSEPLNGGPAVFCPVQAAFAYL